MKVCVLARPQNRWKKKKKYKSRYGETRIAYVREKTSKHKCNLCGKAMHGMPHGKTRSKTRKLSKTERRPSAPFAGTLCNICRKRVIEEAIKVGAGIKELGKTELRHRKFIEICLKKVK